MKNNFIFDNKMAKLKVKLYKVKELILKNSNVFFFDYPVYGNIGDMLIWKGTEEYFRESKIHVKKRYSYHQVIRKLEHGGKMKIPFNATIICQGGGNFGDLYNVHQKLRKLLVEHFPKHRIIILPQTIHYENKEKLDEDLKMFKKHDDFHLFVRDRNSLKVATNYLKNVYLCPDMAHAIYPIKTYSNNGTETLYFIRKDKEKANNQSILLKNKFFDWDQLFNKFDKGLLWLFKFMHYSSKINKLIPPNLLSKLWWFYTNYIIKKAISFYEKKDIIITSRLHGHILACLMNKKNKLLDNSYGKNSRYFMCWTYDVRNSQMLSTQKFADEGSN